jgi:hypothetical protein
MHGHSHDEGGFGHHHLHHNHPIGPELQSHPLGGGVADSRAGLRELSEAFIDGFRNAEDKTSYLRLAEVPFSISAEDGLPRRLVDVSIASSWQVATASPGFASRDLVYLPFPGPMVRERTTLTFVYVSLTGRTDVDLVSFLAGRFARAGA